MEDNSCDKKDVAKEDVPVTAAAASSEVDTAVTSAAAAAAAVVDPRPSPAPSSTSSSARRPYVPQFSAATQMILSRISSKPGSLSAALSSASSVARSIEKSTFEDAKRRLVMGMNTSLTMPMPMPLSTPARKPAATSSSSSSSRTLTMPMGDAFQLRTPAPISGPGTVKAAPVVKPTIPKPVVTAKPRGRPARGTKRKRGKGDDDEEEESTSSLSELSEDDIDALVQSKKAATSTTKSGRHVQKPTQFNPADATGSQKRKHYGKRTAEQALCKVCTRGLSPNTNQIVFCDGCNYCWHQLCHDPYIDDDFVSDETRSWFCSGCLSKREKALAKKKTLVEHKGVSWASKTAAQKRTYLTTLPQSQLINIIMYSTELHPDLPIFPVQEPGTYSSSKRGGAQAQGIISASSSVAAQSPRALSGPASFDHHHKASTPDTTNKTFDHANSAKSSAKRKGSAEATQPERESSVESVPPAWPKIGQGVLANTDLDEGDLKDENDYEAFSVTTYDAKGRKMVENGMRV